MATVCMTIYDTSNISCVLLVLSVLVTIETTQFYKALSQVGSDFTMMTLILPKRTRKKLKSKLSCVYILRSHLSQSKYHNADSSLYQSQLVSICSHNMKD